LVPEEFDRGPVVLAGRPALRNARAEQTAERIGRFEFGIQVVETRRDEIEAGGAQRG